MGPVYRAPAGVNELALYATCVEALEAFRSQLADAGLVAQIRGVTDLPDEAAEVTIDFVGSGGIADVLEFTITKSGRPTLDADGLRNWLHEVLPTVVGG